MQNFVLANHSLLPKKCVEKTALLRPLPQLLLFFYFDKIFAFNSFNLRFHSFIITIGHGARKKDINKSFAHVTPEKDSLPKKKQIWG